MKFSEYLENRRPVNKEKQRLEQHIQDLLSLWRDTAVAVAGSSNCERDDSPGRFATQVLMDYQKFCDKIRWPK